MKKWFVGFLLTFIVIWGIVYFVIPNKLEIAKTTYINIGADVVARHLEHTKWDLWWPKKSSDVDTTTGSKPLHTLNNNGYAINHQLFDAVEINIITDSDTLRSTILVVPLNTDSTALHWRGTLETGFSPIQKIKQYQRATQIKKDMTLILESLDSFLRNGRALYNIPIDRSTVKDTLLISTKKELDHYPNTEEVYELVGILKRYISQMKAKETNYPMLNIMNTGSNHFRLMVAIPVDKVLPDNENFAFKRMVPGNILVTDVTGGRYTIKKALDEMEFYVKENRLTSPAIPFESMVTDRSKQQDTSKWVTRIYYPIL